MPFPRNPESEPEIFIALEREDETAKTGNSIPPAPSSTPTIPPRLDGVDKNIEIIAEQISTLFIASIDKLRERGRASTDEKEKKAFNRSSIMAQLTNINTYIDITIEINILAYTFHHVLKEKYTDDTRKTPTFMSSVKKALEKTKISLGSRNNMRLTTADKEKMKHHIEIRNFLDALSTQILPELTDLLDQDSFEIILSAQSYENLKEMRNDHPLIDRIISICENCIINYGEGDYLNRFVNKLKIEMKEIIENQSRDNK